MSRKKIFIEFLSSDVRAKVGNNYIAVVYDSYIFAGR